MHGLRERTIKKTNRRRQPRPQAGFFEPCGMTLDSAKASFCSNTNKRIRDCLWAATKISNELSGLFHKSVAYLEREIAQKVSHVAQVLGLKKEKPFEWTTKMLRTAAALLSTPQDSSHQAEHETPSGATQAQVHEHPVQPQHQLTQNQPRLCGPPISARPRRSKVKKTSAPKSEDANFSNTGILLHTEVKPQPPVQFKTQAQPHIGWSVRYGTIGDKTCLLKFKIRMGPPPPTYAGTLFAKPSGVRGVKRKRPEVEIRSGLDPYERPDKIFDIDEERLQSCWNRLGRYIMNPNPR